MGKPHLYNLCPEICFANKPQRTSSLQKGLVRMVVVLALKLGPKPAVNCEGLAHLIQTTREQSATGGSCGAFINISVFLAFPHIRLVPRCQIFQPNELSFFLGPIFCVTTPLKKALETSQGKSNLTCVGFYCPRRCHMRSLRS